jgi:flavin-binding protein dodecin
MPESVYRVTEVIGVSTESWEAATRAAVQTVRFPGAAGDLVQVRVGRLAAKHIRRR